MFHPETVRAEEPLRYKAVLVAVLQAETYLRVRALRKRLAGLCAFGRDREPRAAIFRCKVVHHRAPGGNEDASGGKVSIIAASGGSASFGSTDAASSSGKVSLCTGEGRTKSGGITLATGSAGRSGNLTLDVGESSSGAGGQLELAAGDSSQKLLQVNTQLSVSLVEQS